ncbi:MAG: hypothetical protein ACRDH9_02970 [Actinomycetota bacterium]
MVAVGLPIALLLGAIAELAAGVIGRFLGGDRKWWSGVSGIGSDVVRLLKDRSGDQRVAVVEAGGAAAALLGAGIATAGALGVGPDDLVLLYLSLAVATVGAMTVGAVQTTPTGLAESGRRRLIAALAEPAFAIALGTMFLRYGALDLEAVRGTQQVLGTGAVLGPALATAGLIVAAIALVASGALKLPAVPAADRRGRGLRAGAGTALLLRLCRWSLAGATSLVAGVLLAGGGIDPFSVQSVIPVAVGAAGVAIVMGAAGSGLARVPEKWRLAVLGIALVLSGAAAAMVVLA